MNYSVAPAFADEVMYQYQPYKSVGPRRERFYAVKAFQLPAIPVFLIGKISGEFVLVQPLQVNIEQDEDDSYIVSDDVFLVYGDGQTSSDALRDYAASLIKYFQLVEKNAEANEFDKALLSQLESY